jgi:hypothetical protein
MEVRLIKKVLLFVFPLVLLFVYTEIKARAIVKSDLDKKKILLEAKLDSIEILTLGSSHGLEGINPKFLKKHTFNLAHSGQATYYDVKLCMKYYEKIPNLKLVILPISYFSLTRYFINARKLDYYQTFNIQHDSLKMDFLDKSVAAKILPRVCLNVLLDKYVEPPYINIDKNGFLAMDSIDKNKRISNKLGLEKKNSFESIMSESVRTQSEILIDTLISKLITKDIELVFITLPQYKTVSQYFNPKILKQNKDFLQKMCKKYKCQYFDYQDDSRFAIDDFWDNDHLNYIGAEKFTKIINEEILGCK